MRRKPHLELEQVIYEMLGDLHRRTGKSYEEILRDAIALERWVDDQRQQDRCHPA